MHLAPVNQVDSTYLCTHAHYFQRNTINRHSIHRICMESDDWKVCNTWLLGGGIISLISPGSKGTGPHGSCSLQLSRPSSLEMKSAPSLWSVQKELGHSSQKETASFPHTSHWCHGHSHLPNNKTTGKVIRNVQRAGNVLNIMCINNNYTNQNCFVSHKKYLTICVPGIDNDKLNDFNPPPIYSWHKKKIMYCITQLLKAHQTNDVRALEPKEWL